MGYYVQTMQEALRTFQWSPDMKKVKFVPFALKADVKTKDIFTNMIVYNSLENNKKTFTQVLGVSLDNMLEIRDLIIEGCPYITHIDPTQLTAKQGRWKIYTSKAKLETVEKWLTENLARMVASLDMSIPVPGFEIPRLVISTRISALHVQEIEAIAITVPNIEDASTFPNLVIRTRSTTRQGAWTSSSKVNNTSVAMSSYLTPDVSVVTPSARTQPNLPFTDSSPTSPIMMGVYKQLEENRVSLGKLEASRSQEKEQIQNIVETLNSLRGTIEEDKATFQQQMHETALALRLLTTGQTNLQQSMVLRDNQQASELSTIRDAIAQLTLSLQDLMLIRTTLPITTPPRLLRTASDTHASDADDVLAFDQKRSISDRSPSKHSPRFNKVSRTTEGMETDAGAPASRPSPSIRQTP